jgi:hypothetical protein
VGRLGDTAVDGDSACFTKFLSQGTAGTNAT